MTVSKGIKQVIVIRKDLGMRKGKMVAQGAHASLKVFLDKAGIEGVIDHNNKTKDYTITFNITEDMLIWMTNGRYTKICVGVNSEDELLTIYQEADKAGLPHSLIRDAGLTEFDKPTYTAVAVGPAPSNVIDKITGHLPLL